MSRNPRRGLFFLILLGLFLFAVLPALAHANLLRSDPAANSAQPLSPTVVHLWFSEDVEPSFTNVRVLTPAGAQVDLYRPDGAIGLVRRFRDKNWSFTDCTSRMVMEKLAIGTAFAFDQHFRQFGTVSVVP